MSKLNPNYDPDARFAEIQAGLWDQAVTDAAKYLGSPDPINEDWIKLLSDTGFDSDETIAKILAYVAIGGNDTAKDKLLHSLTFMKTTAMLNDEEWNDAS